MANDIIKKYKLNKDEIKRSKIDTKILEEIDNHYISIQDKLLKCIKAEQDILTDCKTVHSIKRRIKSPRSLIKKIIRKSYDVNKDNYLNKITDIVGLRAIHLTKNDWLNIHTYISENWDLSEQPMAYVREGDNEFIRKNLEDNGCVVENHPYGYRSVHYIAKTILRPKTEIQIEIQVRTIFEEGWSEVDHKYRYPNDIENSFLNGSSNILNQIAGIADQMSLFIDDFQSEYKSSLILTEELTQAKEEMEKIQTNIQNKNYPDVLQNIAQMGNNFSKVFETIRERNENLAKAMNQLGSLNMNYDLLNKSMLPASYDMHTLESYLNKNR